MFATWQYSFVVFDFPCLVSLISTVVAEAVFQDDGDSESDSSSPRSELVELQPTMRARYEGMYHCEFCPYSSCSLYNVTRHERTHTGEKPFRCSVCERAFAQIGDLRIHMRTHTGEKPFSCEVCPKAFARSQSLTIHKRVHTSETNAWVRDLRHAISGGMEELFNVQSALHCLSVLCSNEVEK